MSWIKVEKAAPRVAAVGAKLSLRVGKTRSSLTVTLPGAACGAHGWDRYERADVYVGEGTEAGQLRFTPAADGLMAVRRYKSAVILNVPEQKGWPNASAKFKFAQLDWDGIHAMVTLPAVFTGAAPGGADGGIAMASAVATRPAPHGKPRDLVTTGSTVSLGSKHVQLNSKHLKCFGLLEKSWGGSVRRENLMNTLDLSQSELPIFLKMFREKIAPLGLVVVSSAGEGYMLSIAPEATA